MKITLIKLSESNAFLVQGQKAILVDTGTPKDVGKILKALRDAGLTPEDLSLIVLTHGHGDHAGGLSGLRRTLKVPVVAGKRDTPILQKGQNGKLTPLSLLGKTLKKHYEAFAWPAALADLTIDAPMDLSPYGVAGKILPTPGHTAGSLSVLLENGEAIIGDLLSGGFLGGMFFPSKPTLPVFAEDQRALLQNTKELLDQGARVFYVGHGGPLHHPRVARWLNQAVRQQ